jgi:peptide/nickel transport system permease protein
MLQYVIRRLLYSIVVLFVASFLTFTFVAVSGDPLAPLRITPNVSPQTVQNVTERKHLDEPIPVR